MGVLGTRIQEARRLRKLSQLQLARSMGDHHRQMISRVERGHSTMSASSLLAAARSLGVSVDYLYGLTDDPTPVGDRVGEAEERAHQEEQKREELEDALRRTERVLDQMRKYAQRTEAELERLRARVGQVATDGLTDETEPDAKPIPVHRLQTAAGSGAFDLDETVKTYAYFRSEWLFRKGLAADRCNIIGVAGESMEPTLPAGCVILVDRNRTKRYRGHIFVVRTEDGLVVKRAGKDEGGGWQLVSDHPEWKPQPWPYGAEVIGEVKWMAREL